MSSKSWVAAALVAMLASLPIVRAACDAACVVEPVPLAAQTLPEHCTSHEPAAPKQDANGPTEPDQDEPCGHEHASIRLAASSTIPDRAAMAGIASPAPAPQFRLIRHDVPTDITRPMYSASLSRFTPLRI